MNVWDCLFRHATLATMDTERDEHYGIITDAAIAVHSDSIVWIGKDADLPEFDCHEEIDCEGKLITPGLIDCHTHLVYGGSRANEFEMRLQGMSYEEVAKKGGGIVSTVKATRNATEEELHTAAQKRLNALLAEGVTTVEIKSGYGLDTDTELKMLRVIESLKKESVQAIRATFLGAHAVPPEFKGNTSGYIDLVCDEMLPAVAEASLADAVDAFCEGIGFSHEETRKVFEKAQSLGLPVKLHAEQLSDLEGAALVASFNGLSADHLEFVSESGIEAMAKAGTVAVLLPGAFYFLRETQLPPVALLRKHQVPIAIATDMNPGSSPICSLLLSMNMACTLFRMTPAEALAGTTRHAAKALGLTDRGVLAEGLRADLCVWDVSEPAELAYQFGVHKPIQVLVGGDVVIE